MIPATGLGYGAAYAHRGRCHPPLLRIRDVTARGALYGLAAVPLLAAASLFIGDHHNRLTFLAVAGMLAAALAVSGILVGLFSGGPAGETSGAAATGTPSAARPGPLPSRPRFSCGSGCWPWCCSPAPSACTTWWTALGTTAGCTATEPPALSAAELGR